MRIYAVTPIHVDADELLRRQARYDALCPAGLRIELHDLGLGAPRALETAEQVRDSEALVVEALTAAPPGYDALLPDCVLDPGVDQLAGRLPVLGLLRISMGWQILAGQRPGAVARNPAIADELAARVQAYGWSDAFGGVEVLDLDVHAIADTTRWNRALGSALDRLREAGATAVINGCSAVDVNGCSAPPGVRMVDPAALALRLLAAGEAT
ncbi:aspartate/glutamate racemase family protein [Pseudonocardia nigra]|uniref:aspartate/glutamate racemase family protein n=1 Tax=Pseudonocardia nigra TaxID=1921578 RepID=UPI001C5E84DD|nr:aspartate/glutamate racemase family protein [Pseudonocardia nigra]